MNTKPYLVTSGSLFAVIAILQGLRFVNQWPAQIGTLIIPLWPSGIFAGVAAGVSIWAFRLACKGRTQG